MATIGEAKQYYKPGEESSEKIPLRITDEEANKFQGGQAGLKASGYLLRDTSPTTVSQGSEGVRAQVNGTKTSASGLVTDVTDSQAKMTIDDLTKSLGLTSPNAGLSADEESQVKTAGMEEFNKYTPLINAAEEEKRRGMPKAVIGGGERGGFESTQFAGASALVPTQGGNFVGEGGLLNQIKSDYDRNISDLKAKQIEAMRLAEVKAKEAIRTGRESSNKQAIELFRLANEANAHILDMQKKRLDLVAGYRKEDEAKVASIATSLSSVLGDDNNANMQTIIDSAKQYGVDPNMLIGAVNKEIKDAMFFKSGDFVSLMKELPAGQSKTITDPFTGRKYTIEGASTDKPNIITVKDDKGVVRGIDKETGKELWKSDAGIGGTKSTVNISLGAVGGRTPVTLGGKQIGYQTYNDKTGRTSFVSIDESKYPSSATGTLPVGAQLGTFSSGNPSAADELADALNQAIGE